MVNLAFVVYAGDAAAAERALAPIRAIAPPIADQLKPMPYPEIYPPAEDDYHPLAADRTMFLDRVDRSVAQTNVQWSDEHMRFSCALMAGAQLRVLGGAMGRIPQDATAYALRSSRIMVNLFSIYGQAEEAAAHKAWIDGFAAALEQGDTGAYVNFLGTDGAARIRAAYPGPTYDRLAAIKARYDPTNLFKLNQNIPPSE